MDLSASGIASWMLRTRWSARLPIGLFKAGLGWMFGSRVLLLEHRGRKSGQPRFVCLEVVERQAPDRIVIVSGFGERADWYRNLNADPNCFVSTGRMRRVPAIARFISSAEADKVIERYQLAHPGLWEQLRSAIEKAIGHPVQCLPMVELKLSTQPGSKQKAKR
ncbi:MAG: nitroreductase family deazaflavin-dependent oxidoreductase [Microbacteriaceae bacterium]|nr:nitroreductase family deazaflavin-dependent oxidoreductase [Microbacteriaceae bacterium]